MNAFTAIIERCPEPKLYVGYVPGFPGAHSQGTTMEELHENLREVIQMLLEDGFNRGQPLKVKFVPLDSIFKG